MARLLLPAVALAAVAACTAADDVGPGPANTHLPGPMGPGAERFTRPMSLAAEQNACAYVTVEPTPTPVGFSPTPRPTSTSVPTPKGPTPTPGPTIAIPGYPELFLPRPDTLLWLDAIVTVYVEIEGRTDQVIQGLVVDPRGLVMTSLEPRWNVTGARVVIDGIAMQASLRTRDPRTDAVILDVDLNGLTAAPLEQANIQAGQPGFAWLRDQDGELNRRRVFLSPTENAPDHLAAMLRLKSGTVPAGTTITDLDGNVVGITQDEGRSWWAGGFVSGPPPGPDQPVVLIKTFEGFGTFSESIPSGVAYDRFVDGPVTREIVAEAVEPLFSQLGELVSLEELDWPGRDAAWGGGTALELLFAEPQRLMGREGDLAGEAKYVALTWGRGGQPDLLLCGEDENRVAAAFEMPLIGYLEQVMDEAPPSSRSVVRAVDLPVAEEDRRSYPYRWEVTTDKSAYTPGEVVTFTVRIENISEFSIPLSYTPPMVYVRHLGPRYDVAVTSHGDESHPLRPGESISFEVEWDAVTAWGEAMTPGEYEARALIANTEGYWARAYDGPEVEFEVVGG